jgi:hypothetical protein
VKKVFVKKDSPEAREWYPQMRGTWCELVEIDINKGVYKVYTPNKEDWIFLSELDIDFDMQEES